MPLSEGSAAGWGDLVFSNPPVCSGPVHLPIRGRLGKTLVIDLASLFTWTKKCLNTATLLYKSISGLFNL